MAARRIGLTLPPSLQFLAGWLGMWLGRVLQEQVEFLKAENRLLREKLGTKRIRGHGPGTKTAGRAGQEVGEEGTGSSGDDRIARDDPALVSGAGGGEVRWQRATRTGTALLPPRGRMNSCPIGPADARIESRHTTGAGNNAPHRRRGYRMGVRALTQLARVPTEGCRDFTRRGQVCGSDSSTPLQSATKPASIADRLSSPMT